jgi:hypothetical protein
MPRLDLFQGWLSAPADIHDLQATRLETAAGWRVNGLCDFAFDFGDGSFISRIGDRRPG